MTSHNGPTNHSPTTVVPNVPEWFPIFGLPGCAGRNSAVVTLRTFSRFRCVTGIREHPKVVRQVCSHKTHPKEHRNAQNHRDLGPERVAGRLRDDLQRRGDRQQDQADLHRPDAEGAGLQGIVDRVGRVMTVRHEQAIKEPPHPRRVLMTVIMVMSVPAAVLVVTALIVVVAILDVDRVAVLTVNMLSAVARHRCRIGVYGIMRAGRIVRVDMPGRA